MNQAMLSRRGDTATQRLIIALLRDSGAMIQAEICSTLGLHRNTVYRVLGRLHKSRVVFVESWVHPASSNTLTRAWDLRTTEKQSDATRPKPKVRSAVNQDYRDRHKARLAARRSVKRADEPNIWRGLLP